MYKVQQLGNIQRVILLYKGKAGEGAQSVLAWGQAPNLGLASARVSVSALAASSPDCRDFDRFLLSWCLQGLEHCGWHPLCVPHHTPLTLCPLLTVPFFLFGGNMVSVSFRLTSLATVWALMHREHHLRLSGTRREDGESWRYSLRWHPALWEPVSVIHA